MCRSYVLVRRNKHGKDLKTCVKCFFMFMVLKKQFIWFTHFCRELSFVAITRFLRGTFGQNLMGGGTKTFYRTRIEASLSFESFIDHVVAIKSNFWGLGWVKMAKLRYGWDMKVSHKCRIVKVRQGVVAGSQVPASLVKGVGEPDLVDPGRVVLGCAVQRMCLCSAEHENF